MEEEEEEEDSMSLWAVWEFVIHTLVATVLFALIAGGAVVLHLIHAALVAAGVDIFVANVVKHGEYVVLGVDAALFVIFLGKASARAVAKF